VKDQHHYEALVTEWLEHLGLPRASDLDETSLVINVDQRFDVHCCLSDAGKLLLLAEWPARHATAGDLSRALASNRPVDALAQPVFALVGERWQCWLSRSVAGYGLSTLLADFGRIVRCAEGFIDAREPDDRPATTHVYL
jgi:hypothetical protein